jgi:hypothetical protein
VWAEAFADNADGPRRNPGEHRSIFERVLKFYVDKAVVVDPDSTNTIDRLLFEIELQAREAHLPLDSDEQRLSEILGGPQHNPNTATPEVLSTRKRLPAKAPRGNMGGFGQRRNDR